MNIFDLGFIKLGVFDIIDIIVFAFIIYQVYNLIKGTIALNIFVGLLSIYLFWLSVKALDMRLLSGVLDAFIGVGVIALIVVFQQEIRRFLIIIGKNSAVTRSKIFGGGPFWSRKTAGNKYNYKPIIDAVANLSKTRTGAIIIFLKHVEDYSWANNGVEIDGKISRRLIESVFAKTSPLHDGALIITEETIKSASNILPLTDQPDLPTHFGLRHRASLGATDNNTDTLAIIVSEENGKISYAFSGKITTAANIEEVAQRITEF
ncbi:MAG: diadenylate cyclase [Sphingobacteriales bacterium]|jgi:diadenylate cyclase